MKMALPETVGFVSVDTDTYRAVLEGAPVAVDATRIAESEDSTPVDVGTAP